MFDGRGVAYREQTHSMLMIKLKQLFIFTNNPLDVYTKYNKFAITIYKTFTSVIFTFHTTITQSHVCNPVYSPMVWFSHKFSISVLLSH